GGGTCTEGSVHRHTGCGLWTLRTYACLERVARASFRYPCFDQHQHDTNIICSVCARHELRKGLAFLPASLVCTISHRQTGKFKFATVKLTSSCPLTPPQQ
ncbi:unnamed protein product, partial [Ectocarpus sp. 12 AP-2014]